MAAGPESKFRKKICDELIKCNAKIYPILGGLTKMGDRVYGQNPGMSDVIMVHSYTGIVFLEFKAANGKLSAVQQRFLEEVNERAPYSGFVARDGNGSLSRVENETGVTLFYFDTANSLLTGIRDLQEDGRQ